MKQLFTLLAQKWPKYLIEMVVITVGILGAFMLDSWNDNRIEHNKELNYLANIKADIGLNITSLEEFIIARKSSIQSVNTILPYFNGKELRNFHQFNYNNLAVLDWYPFVQHANTMNELISSGNLSLISNKSILHQIQEMQTNYEDIFFVENEMQQDYERYLYQPYFNLIDLEVALLNYSNQINELDSNNIEKLNKLDLEQLLTNKLYKNGLVLSSYNSNILVDRYSKMIKKSHQIITMIDNQIASQ